MRFHRVATLLLEAMFFLAVLSISLLAVAVFFYSFYEVYLLLKKIAFGSITDGEIIGKGLKTVDLMLMGTVFIIIGIGLYELFIAPIRDLPDWLIISDIDQLKNMLIKVLILVMGVSFTGSVVTVGGDSNLLNQGVGIAAVIIALSFFLQVKIIGKKGDKEETPMIGEDK